MEGGLQGATPGYKAAERYYRRARIRARYGQASAGPPDLLRLVAQRAGKVVS